MALRHIFTVLIIILINAASQTSPAQRNYPIRATVQYTPPYSLFLGDYATPKLIITLTGQDLLDANCPYKLSISLECQNVKITTKPSYNPAPLYISGGQTIVLTGAELARYFDIQNLDFHGITAAKYLQDGQMPEGFYRMNIKVLNYNDNRQISNTAFVMFNARMGKPPILTLPKNKSLIPPNQQVMPITFSWTPKTVGAYQYRIEIWECAVPDIPVQTVVSTVRPIHTQTTFSPMLTIHPANLNMKPGTEYAWRITVEDPQNQQKFANQGRSEIFTFTYKRKPEGVTGLKFTHRGLRVTWSWEMSPAHSSYHFQYYDPQTGRTIDIPCEYNTFSINLPQTGYHIKARVQAECYNDPTLLSDFTPYLDTYVEPIPVPEYECGKVFPDREITNLELKHSFAPGEIVESKNGDTRYEIIYANENNGYLSGQFFMIMDCWGGAKIRCEFSQTQINTDNIVLKTIFHNVPDSTLYVKPETIRKEIQEAFFDAATVLTDFSIKDTIKLDKPYTYLYVNPSGKVVAVSLNNNGKTEEKTTEISATNLKENTLIQGKNGEELVLTKKGQVMGKTEFNATGGNSVLLKEYHRKSDSLAQWLINFSPDTKNQTYAFDHIGSGNHGIFSSSEYYPQSGSYDFRYKSVECGKNDKVKVEFDTYPEADSVVFKDKYGVTYPISSKDNVLSFTGVSKADTNYIYAYRGDKKIGKLFLNTYQKKTYKVVLISVNKATLPNTKDLENYLNKVYNQCAVSFKIETRDLQVSGIENFTHGGTKVAGSVWNASQKAVLEAFGEKYEDNTAYLFFIPKAETGGVAGYMPRYYPYGFIYPGAANRTIAHELGHGIAGLEHPFPESQVSGSTQNLMDYRDGTELWHFQWDMLQDPSRKIFKWWQNEQDAEAFWTDYFVNVMLFIERFRHAYVNRNKGEKFQWKLFDGDFSTENLILWNSKKYAVVGFKVGSVFDGIDIEKKGFVQNGDKFEFVYPNFKIYSTGDITDYLFPPEDQYKEQMKKLRKHIVDNLSNRNYIIKFLSYMPEKEFYNFDFEQRKKILTVLSEGSLTEPLAIIGIPEMINGEKAAINLIKYVPDSQIDDLYNLLKGPANLYEPLSSAIDDIGGNPNNTEFNKIVSEMAKKCSDNTKLIAKIRDYAKHGDRLLDQQYEDLRRCVESCPDNLLPNLFDCMFGYKVDNATNKVEQGLFASLSDTPGRHAVSNTLCKKLKQYYGGDLSKMPLEKRIEYLKYLGLNGPSKLTIATKNPYQGELIYALFNSTPQKDLPEVIKLLDYHGRYLYSGLRDRSGERYPDFVKTVYSRIKSTYSNAVIPIEKRKEYLSYYSKQKENYEPEEFIVIDLISSTPTKDVSELFNYMDTNDMFRKFSFSVDNNFLGFGGSDNLDKFAETLHKKWIDSGGDEKSYLSMTKQYFVSPWLKERALIHFDYTISAQTARELTGIYAAISYGFGFDSQGNIAFFGNANLFAYLLTLGYQFNKITELCNKSMKQALDDYLKTAKETNQCNILSGTGISAEGSINFDLWAPDVSALFGLGTTQSIQLSIPSFPSFSVSMLLNSDDKGNFIGFGFGVGKDFLNGGLPIAYQRVSETNRGLIFNIADIPYFFSNIIDGRINIDTTIKSNTPSFDVDENKFLVIKSCFGTIKTHIMATKFEGKSYIQTNNSKLQ